MNFLRFLFGKPADPEEITPTPQHTVDQGADLPELPEGDWYWEVEMSTLVPSRVLVSLVKDRTIRATKFFDVSEGTEGLRKTADKIRADYSHYWEVDGTNGMLGIYRNSNLRKPQK